MNIDEKIKEIKETLRSGAVLSPGQYAEMHRILAGEYAFTSDSFGMLEYDKSLEIAHLRNREDIKSDAQAERIYFATENGKFHSQTRLKLKSLEKMLSSLKASIEVAKTEWQNENDSFKWKQTKTYNN